MGVLPKEGPHDLVPQGEFWSQEKNILNYYLTDCYGPGCAGLTHVEYQLHTGVVTVNSIVLLG